MLEKASQRRPSRISKSTLAWKLSAVAIVAVWILAALFFFKTNMTVQVPGEIAAPVATAGGRSSNGGGGDAPPRVRAQRVATATSRRNSGADISTLQERGFQMAARAADAEVLAQQAVVAAGLEPGGSRSPRRSLRHARTTARPVAVAGEARKERNGEKGAQEKVTRALPAVHHFNRKTVSAEIREKARLIRQAKGSQQELTVKDAVKKPMRTMPHNHPSRA